MSVKLLDRVTIVCPQPTTNPKISYEYTKLYAVSLISQMYEMMRKIEI